MFSGLQTISQATPNFVLSFLQDSYQVCIRELLIACFLVVQQPCIHFSTLVRQDCSLSFLPSDIQSIRRTGYFDSRLSRFPTFLQFCFFAFLQSGRQDNLQSAHLEIWADCLLAYIQAQRTNQFHSIVQGWQCLAFRGSIWHCYTVQHFR